MKSYVRRFSQSIFKFPFSLCALALVVVCFLTPRRSRVGFSLLKPEPDGVKRNITWSDLKIDEDICRQSENVLIWWASAVYGSVIVIGANVGPVHNDPIFHSLTKAGTFGAMQKVFIEPIPPLFEALKRNTDHLENVVLVNAALTPMSTTAVLYCYALPISGEPKKENTVFPKWFSQICSESKDRLTSNYDVGAMLAKRKIPASQLSRLRIVNFTVPGFSYTEMVEKYDVRPARYIQIDVEGFDDIVLQSLPFGAEGFSPLVVVFEHMLLSAERYDAAVRLLRSHSYATCKRGQNTYALKVL
mmetsp:Transcript_11847/g.24895  ORF Transcript_11847/g.24895 Transcript_11847/m.24895 type:complete len:302 (+) Transcript_11847:1092-1997(+)|eukprot:CAMPEP_0118930186 /NCGR_PEP_ID=MMETSP1169-20130426/6953_1 /TAXON_ID=36882 /ORGANISM="Pyramimonas obovata, Strain CCMP722" /LENGTH=301 /DNA_ID=CAMNT_0006872505 /DNA_START=1088 /DNA_END=1993 /DNA_ORIENTATION=+